MAAKKYKAYRGAEYGRRTCLRCGRDFDSDGPGNRVCPQCTPTNRAIGSLPAVLPVRFDLSVRVKGIGST